MTILWSILLLLYSLFCLFFWGGEYPWHMEVSRLGVTSELKLPAYTTATATPIPSHICDLHYSSWQCQILNLLSKARDWTCILMGSSQIPFLQAMTGIPIVLFIKWHSPNWINHFIKIVIAYILKGRKNICRFF